MGNQLFGVFTIVPRASPLFQRAVTLSKYVWTFAAEQLFAGRGLRSGSRLFQPNQQAALR